MDRVKNELRSPRAEARRKQSRKLGEALEKSGRFNVKARARNDI
jgi:hypothetical protein